MIRTLVLANLATVAFGALPGVPEAPDAMRDSPWLKIGNDSWAVPAGPDDNRTAEMSGGFRIGPATIVIDHSTLTAFGVFDGGGQPTRIDEMIVTAGTKVGRFVTIGLGGIARGNLEGQVVQDSFHGATRSGVRYHEPYDDTSYAGIAYALASGRWKVPNGDLTLFASASGTATTDGEDLGDVFFGFGLYEVASLHIGIREQVRHTALSSPTIKRVFTYESGTWVDVGIAFWRVELALRYSPFHHESVADITLRF